MSKTDWKTIPGKLNAAGFTVCYDRISYDLKNPVWRANAKRGGKEWSCLGGDLETALVELERQIQESAPDWHEIASVEKSNFTTAQYTETV